MVKIYGFLWLAMGLTAALLFVTGNLTLTAAIAFGFVAFGLVFIGMIGVLPATVTHPQPKRLVVEEVRIDSADASARVRSVRSSVHA